MRKVDAWAGVPVCFALTALRRLGDLARRPGRPSGIRRILFVKLAEQGATVLAYPAIRKAVQMVGRENVFFLVFEENRFILDVMEIIPQQNVIAIRTGGLLTLAWGLLRALRRIRRLGPDAAIDFEFFARSSAVLTYLSGAWTRVGLHGLDDPAPYRGDLMTHRIRYDSRLHTTDAFLRMVESMRGCPETGTDAPHLGKGRDPTLSIREPVPVSGQSLTGPPSDVPDPGVPVAPREADLPVFTPRPDELARVKSVLERQTGAARFSPLVLLNANASDLLPQRRWPAERYVELGRRLIERFPQIHVAFTGAPDEASVAQKLVASVASDRCFSMAGKTTLRELLVLYCLADLLVTNDSGPAHFATLTPIRVITLFGPETPALFGARTPRAHIMWKNLACSPCVNAYNNRLSTCGDNRCMQDITADDVFSLACRVLEL